MIKKLIVNDIRQNKLLSASVTFFMGISAMLIGLSVLLFTGLLGSIDSLMERAKTPDFLQMHAGAVEEKALEVFADEREEIDQWQVCRFLNLDSASIMLGGHSLSDSTQDNGLCIQGKGFDYLVDLDNELPQVREGEIYVPACYMKEYDVAEGDAMTIGKESFVIGGFIRDSQMNSMMASSKRFLVSEADYEKMRAVGVEEYLIEYTLLEGSDITAFSDAYMDAGLPANGPTITKPLIRMLNALSDGLMIFVILLAGVVVLLISMLCIRFILLTSLEKEKKEIGMLKAIGIARQDIRKLYFSKFAALSAVGAALGLLLAVLLANPLTEKLQRLYGASANIGITAAITVLGVALVELLLLLSVRHTLKKMEKVTAVQALYGKEGFTGKGHARQYFLIILVVAAGMFLMLIPQNISSTIASEKFVTYMGIGDAEIRMDVRQTKDIVEKTGEISGLLEQDERVEAYTALQTGSVLAELSDGSTTHLMVEKGNQSIFPVSYLQGREPQKSGEIALSVLNAEALELKLGDELTLVEHEAKCRYRVCGIYSDITNGGKTAKSYETEETLQKAEADEVMWSIFYVSLKEGVSREAFMKDYQGISDMEVADIRDCVTAIYGPTISQLRQASVVTAVAALAVIFVVTILFMRLLVERGRAESALKKALGFTSAEIRSDYFKRGIVCTVAGILIGILGGNLLGEKIAGAALKSLGAAGFQFHTDNVMVYLVLPACVLILTLAAVRLGIMEIRKIQAKECV